MNSSPGNLVARSGFSVPGHGCPRLLHSPEPQHNISHISLLNTMSITCNTFSFFSRFSCPWTKQKLRCQFEHVTTESLPGSISEGAWATLLPVCLSTQSTHKRTGRWRFNSRDRHRTRASILSKWATSRNCIVKGDCCWILKVANVSETEELKWSVTVRQTDYRYSLLI